MLKSRAERSSLHPIRLHLWLAFLGKPCMGAVTQIRDLDSTPRAEHNYTFLESDHFITNERRDRSGIVCAFLTFKKGG